MSIQNNTQDVAFTYNIDTPLLNNSYANRIALENFEYESNTNLSKLSRYADSGSSLVVKDFNDVDFDDTKNVYKSKYCELKNRVNGPNYYYLTYNNSNNFRLGSIYNEIIIDPPKDGTIYFRYFYSTTKYFTIQLGFATRQLSFYNYSTLIKRYYNFVPIEGSYEYIYLYLTPIYVFVNFTLQFGFTTYNFTKGTIISTNTSLTDLEPYANYKISKFQQIFYYPLVNNIYKIVAIDMNYNTDRRLYTQNSIRPINYLSYIKEFYSTVIPFYSKTLHSSSNIFRYATTIYQNRYLRYKTNCSQNDFDTYDFNSELDTSFNMKIECSLNDTIEATDFRFNFNTSALYLTFSDKIYLYRYAYENYTQIDYKEYSYSSFFDNSSVIIAQFKNNIFSIGILYNFSVISHEYYFDGNFKNLSIRGYFTNFEYKTLTTTNTIKINNSTNSIDIFHDNFTIRDKITTISSYFEFNEVITINPIPYNAIIVNDKYYLLEAEYITSLNIESSKLGGNGYFTITENFEKIYECFPDNTSSHANIDTDFLYHKNGGKLYLKSQFYTSSIYEVTIFILIHYTKVLIFTDHLPQDNLLIAKILEILIPITIFFLIVIAFKSNSNSKYLSMIGMYIAIFTFYLMEYMSLLFMILCMGFLTFGFALIIRKEKNNGGI